MQSPSLPIWGSARVVCDEEALQASKDLILKEVLRDDESRILCKNCDSIPYRFYQFCQLMVAFRFIWPLVLFGCPFLDTAALSLKVLWTFPVWGNTLWSLAYLIWISGKPRDYFVPITEDCFDPKSPKHSRGQLRVLSQKQAQRLECMFLTKRWAARILIMDLWWCTTGIICIGWLQMRLKGCNNRVTVASSAVILTLLVLFATMMTKFLLGIAERLNGYRYTAHRIKIYYYASEFFERADADLRATANKSRAGAETAHEEAEERGTSSVTAAAQSQTLSAQVTSLEAQVTGLEANNTHNEVLAIGLRNRVRHLEDYIDHHLKLPLSSDETRFATARELPLRNSHATQPPKGNSMLPPQNFQMEDSEIQEIDETLDNAASSQSEGHLHQAFDQRTGWMEDCGFRLVHDDSLLRQGNAQSTSARELSAQPSTEMGVMEDIGVTPEKGLTPVDVNARSEWEEV